MVRSTPYSCSRASPRMCADECQNACRDSRTLHEKERSLIAQQAAPPTYCVLHAVANRLPQACGGGECLRALGISRILLVGQSHNACKEHIISDLHRSICTGNQGQHSPECPALCPCSCGNRSLPQSLAQWSGPGFTASPGPHRECVQASARMPAEIVEHCMKRTEGLLHSRLHRPLTVFCMQWRTACPKHVGGEMPESTQDFLDPSSRTEPKRSNML
jgi:hypothetical protein